MLLPSIVIAALSFAAAVSSAPSFSEPEISTDLNDVRFLLYSSGNQGYVEVDRNFDSLAGTGWDPSRRTFVLMHGFFSGEQFFAQFVDGQCQ